MVITLSNHQQQLSRAAIKAAEKLVVRECDEEPKGLFIAYVDDGKNSYDASLEINDAGEVMASGCDCAATAAFCIHRIALLLSLAGWEKKKKAGVKKPRLTKADILLAEVSLPQLKEWVSGLLRTNKDLQLQFIHEFEPRREHYSPEEVKRLTQDAVKAVVKNKRNIDHTQIKTIVDLWKVVHAPVLKIYYDAPYDPEAFRLFMCVIESCGQEYAALNVQAKKIREYLETISRAVQPAIAAIEPEEPWFAAINHYISNLSDPQGRTNLIFLEQLFELMTTSTGARQKKIAGTFIPLYFDEQERYYTVNAGMAKRILTFITGAELTDDYLTMLRPLYWQYDYNRALIKLLLLQDRLDLAERYCLEQIKANVKDEFNFAYLYFLKEIYIRRSQTQSLVQVLRQLLPLTYNFEDYLFIQQHTDSDGEKKDLRARIITRARSGYRSGFLPAIEFLFCLTDHEKDYKKMLEYVNSETPYEMLHQYFVPLALTGKTDFIQALIHKKETWDSDYIEREDGSHLFPDMYQALQKNYPPEIIDAMQAHAASHSGLPNVFIQYITEIRRNPLTP